MIGVLCVDKPPGPTSHDVVDLVRRALGTRRVGHFGTLDPFASGLLACGVGPATRLASWAVGHPKTYRATVRLGWTSTTDDVEGERAPTDAAPAPRAAVEAACAAWVGAVLQVPPAFSAKKVAGARAYRRARAGEAVVLAPASVRIDRIAILDYAWPDLAIEVECGPGTYIRALARDVGAGLGTGGYCLALRRTRSGPFDVADALAWDALGDPARARAALLPPDAAVADLPAVDLPADLAAAVAGGRAIPGPEGPPGPVRLRGPGGLVGIGERLPGPDGPLLQPRRILDPAAAGAA